MCRLTTFGRMVWLDSCIYNNGAMSEPISLRDFHRRNILPLQLAYTFYDVFDNVFEHGDEGSCAWSAVGAK